MKRIKPYVFYYILTINGWDGLSYTFGGTTFRYVGYTPEKGSTFHVTRSKKEVDEECALINGLRVDIGYKPNDPVYEYDVTYPGLNFVNHEDTFQVICEIFSSISQMYNLPGSTVMALPMPGEIRLPENGEMVQCEAIQSLANATPKASMQGVFKLVPFTSYGNAISLESIVQTDREYRDNEIECIVFHTDYKSDETSEPNVVVCKAPGEYDLDFTKFSWLDYRWFAFPIKD